MFYRFVQLMLDSSSLSLPPSDFRAGPVGLVLGSRMRPEGQGNVLVSVYYSGLLVGLQARLQGMTYILFPVLYDLDEKQEGPVSQRARTLGCTVYLPVPFSLIIIRFVGFVVGLTDLLTALVSRSFEAGFIGFEGGFKGE